MTGVVVVSSPLFFFLLLPTSPFPSHLVHSLALDLPFPPPFLSIAARRGAPSSLSRLSLSLTSHDLTLSRLVRLFLPSFSLFFRLQCNVVALSYPSYPVSLYYSRSFERGEKAGEGKRERGQRLLDSSHLSRPATMTTSTSTTTHPPLHSRLLYAFTGIPSNDPISPKCVLLCHASWFLLNTS